jgi:hypothetical protein
MIAMSTSPDGGAARSVLAAAQAEPARNKRRLMRMVRREQTASRRYRIAGPIKAVSGVIQVGAV